MLLLAADCLPVTIPPSSLAYLPPLCTCSLFYKYTFPIKVCLSFYSLQVSDSHILSSPLLKPVLVTELREIPEYLLGKVVSSPKCIHGQTYWSSLLGMVIPKRRRVTDPQRIAEQKDG